MSDLSRRPSYTPRRTREQRAYRLVVVGGVAGAVAVVGLVLAIAGVIGLGIPLIAAIVAIVALLLFRSTVSPRR
jgi:putative flippase GtrA